MYNHHEMAIRRAITGLALHQSDVIQLPPDQVQAGIRVATSFARGKQLPIVAEPSAEGLRITRVSEWAKPSMYPELDKLDVGQSHVFDLPPAAHQRVRMAASARNRAGKVRLMCTREGDAIRVTRLPMTDDEAAACGPIKTTTRSSKYNLDRLADERELRFSLPPAEHHRLRIAVSYKAKTSGWSMRCRLQDDGSMLVYRLDQQ